MMVDIIFSKISKIIPYVEHWWRVHIMILCYVELCRFIIISACWSEPLQERNYLALSISSFSYVEYSFHSIKYMLIIKYANRS
jgi:hypothetical protein